MDKVARLSATDRAALFNETGAARGIANAIIEKDFWVCWTLKRLAALKKQDVPALVFKGGTSLSKAYAAIQRFSEDIDLSFDRAALGYKDERDPENAPSHKKAKELIEDLVADVQKHIANILLPRLTEVITVERGMPKKAGWRLLVDDKDPQSLVFYYPPSLSRKDYAGLEYVNPRVKLEFGARGDPWPMEQKPIRPYAAEQFPDFFETPEVTVDVLALKRTFWEKATALHAEHHRAADSPTPPYFSRHYYDLAMLADHDDGKAAIKDVGLLKAVADHKAVFFRSAWAHYDTARPGTLQLSPKAERLADLRSDYRAMRPMMFDDPAPTFDEVMQRIAKLECLINNA